MMLAAILVGCAIGLVLGLTGAGGSVLAVPLLIFVLGVSPDTAVSFSLAAVFGSALFGVLTRLKKREIVWVPAWFFAAGGLLFAPVGVFLSGYISDTWRLISFTVLMLVIAARMLWQSINAPLQARFVRAGSEGNDDPASPMCPVSESSRFEIRVPCILVLAAAGAATGVLSGIYGVGGGFLIVPVLIMMTQLSMRQAVATSLLIISLVSGSGFVSYLYARGAGDFSGSPLFAWVMAGALAGMFMGTLLSRRIAGPRLQQLFVLAIVAMAVFTLWNLETVSV